MIVFATLPKGTIHVGIAPDVEVHLEALRLQYRGPVTRLRIVDGDSFADALPWLKKLAPYRIAGCPDQYEANPKSLGTLLPHRDWKRQAAKPSHALRDCHPFPASREWWRWLDSTSRALSLTPVEFLTFAAADMARAHNLPSPPPR